MLFVTVYMRPLYKHPSQVAPEHNLMCLSVFQLQDAEKKKFGKCEHIDVDWGVEDEDDEIYQTPTLVSQPLPSPNLQHHHGSSIKRSDTTGNISGILLCLSFE